MITLNLSEKMVSIIEREARLRELSEEEIVERAIEKIYPAEINEPQTEFERSLCAMGFSYGVSLPDSAFSREEMYD